MQKIFGILEAFFDSREARWVQFGGLCAVFATAPMWVSVPVGSYIIAKWCFTKDD